MPRIVIAAGGTAGHVVPALAVADALRARGAEVEFMGGERAEAELVPAAGLSVPPRCGCAGIDRRQPAAGGARGAARGARATVRARRLLRRLGADAVLGGGGYVAGPVGLAARQPAPAARADRGGQPPRRGEPAARAARAARLPGVPDRGARPAPSGVVTGRPVPAGTGRADRAAARARFGIGPEERCVLVFGGSLGARRLNDAALDAFGAAAPCAVLHACGRRDHDDLRRAPRRARLAAALPPVPVHRAVRGRAGRGRPGRGPRRRLGAGAGRGRAAGGAGALSRTRRRPPDANARWIERRARPWWCPTTSSTARGWPARWRRCWARRSGWRRWRTRRAAVARPDAAERIADELLRAGATRVARPAGPSVLARGRPGWPGLRASPCPQTRPEPALRAAACTSSASAGRA